jgi:predicted DNA-binding transcriptional regulator AlpA
MNSAQARSWESVAKMPTRDIPVREGAESSAPAREASRNDPLLTQKEAARFTRMSESWLAKARMRGDGPPYVLFGRAIRYQQSDLTAYIRSRRRLSTSER